VPRIVVLGSLNVDLVVRVPVLPAPGQTVLGDRLETFCGGKGANQAVAAARLDGTVSMVGRVGQDAHGAMLRRELGAAGIDTSGVVEVSDQPTGAALILVDERGQNAIAVAPGANATVGEADVDRAMERLAPGDFLIMQLEIPLPAVQGAIPSARARQVRILLNAAPSTTTSTTLLRDLDVLIVNEQEASALFGVTVTEPESACQALDAAKHAGVGLPIVTLGALGAIYSNEGSCHFVPAFTVKAVDSTAAGDAFVGALAVGLSRGLPLERSVRFANAAGAAAATRPGAQVSLPSLGDLGRQFDVEL
jgi:ribokinase